ncbi:MAG: hypothetical protein K0S09_3252 [Sphingobacteriaceae bacterium]|jgi:hypothetical protein|nr:hypothetical protein [Sphingobacteriaceae bacterium]
MHVYRIALLTVVAALFTACGVSLKPEELYGKWKYVKVEKLNTNPPELLPDYELSSQSPYIEFSKDSNLKIVWGGDILSSGTFRIDGNKIMFKEDLPGGKTREFPFLVSSLEGRNIVFETTTQGGSRVTAIKE